MVLLAIETSTRQTSVALGGQQGVLASQLVAAGRGHAELLTPTIEHLLGLTDLRPDQLSGVAVGVGPGLFTGLRVGVSTARALAQVLRLPIVGIGSLDILAFSARHTSGRICAVADAKRGEVFWAFYRPVPGGVARETEYAVGTAERLAADLEASGEETLLVGDGALRYRAELEASGTPVEFGSASSAFPHAESLMELALPRFIREETARPEEIRPCYVRKSDAEINRRVA
jgi:tRNA threonylcarbamoyladenosine biosynthesis protein TsaB